MMGPWDPMMGCLDGTNDGTRSYDGMGMDPMMMGGPMMGPDPMMMGDPDDDDGTNDGTRSNDGMMGMDPMMMGPDLMIQ